MRRERRGANAVEFAVTFPVFLVIMFGLMEYAWLMFQDNTIAAVATEACRRTAMEDSSTTNMDVALLGHVDDAYNALGFSACSGCTAVTTINGTAPDRLLECSVSRTHPGISQYVIGTLTIDATTSAWLEIQSP